MVLYQNGTLAIADIIAVMGLMNVLRFPAFMSIFSFSMVQMGLASAARIVNIVKAETELDENTGGYANPIEGDIVFENVSFCYQNGDGCDIAVIRMSRSTSGPPDRRDRRADRLRQEHPGAAHQPHV